MFVWKGIVFCQSYVPLPLTGPCRLGNTTAPKSEAHKCPSGEVPLVFVPVGTPGGHPSNQKQHSWAPVKPPRGQTLRSPRHATSWGQSIDKYRNIKNMVYRYKKVSKLDLEFRIRSAGRSLEPRFYVLICLHHLFMFVYTCLYYLYFYTKVTSAPSRDLWWFLLCLWPRQARKR